MNMYKDLSEDEKEVILITRDFWKEASKTGIIKEEWERYNELRRFKFECGLCELFHKYPKDGNCSCPLFLRRKTRLYGIINCKYYVGWKEENRKLYAKIIYYLILSYIKGRN